jgi:hypothetical protein
MKADGRAVGGRSAWSYLGVMPNAQSSLTPCSGTDPCSLLSRYFASGCSLVIQLKPSKRPRLPKGQFSHRCRSNVCSEGDGAEQAVETAPNYRACFGSPLARIPDRFGKHGVKLALGEFLGLRHCRLARGRHLIHRTGTSGQLHWSSPPHRHDLWVGSRWLATALQAQTS